MGALARASHPALYDRGWHPTAVCGAAGAAVAASHLIDAPVDAALAIALLQGGGLRAAFGSHGKSLQVGLAAASGVQAARLARAGARVPLETAARGWEQATGGTFARPQEGQDRAIDENWIKAWPCCLQTHGAIEAAASVRHDHQATDKLAVTVHPVSVQAAAEGPEPADGLQAKFSIPYLTAFTLLHGPPDVESFAPGRPRCGAARPRDRDQDQLRPARIRMRPEHDRGRGTGGDRNRQSSARLARTPDGRTSAAEPSSKACSAQSRRPRSTKTSPPNGSSSASASNPAFATGADGG